MAEQAKLTPLIVTPAQYREGYWVKDGAFIYREHFTVIRRLDNGNYVVIDPQCKLAPTSGQLIKE